MFPHLVTIYPYDGLIFNSLFIVVPAAVMTMLLSWFRVSQHLIEKKKKKQTANQKEYSLITFHNPSTTQYHCTECNVKLKISTQCYHHVQIMRRSGPACCFRLSLHENQKKNRSISGVSEDSSHKCCVTQALGSHFHIPANVQIIFILIFNVYEKTLYFCLSLSRFVKFSLLHALSFLLVPLPPSPSL